MLEHVNVCGVCIYTCLSMCRCVQRISFMYIYMLDHVYVCAKNQLYACLSMCMCVQRVSCMYIYMLESVYVCAKRQLYVYVRTYIMSCMCVVHITIYIYIYIYIYTIYIYIYIYIYICKTGQAHTCVVHMLINISHVLCMCIC